MKAGLIGAPGRWLPGTLVDLSGPIARAGRTPPTGFARIGAAVAASIVVAAAIQPAEAQFRYPDLDNPRFDSFYRYRVELTHLPSNETVVVDAPFACWTSRETAVRQRTPYIVGTRIEATGEAVLVATPDVCDRRRPASKLPPDYLPPVFWAPDGGTTEEIVGRPPAAPNDAGTIEFLIGYVSEAAYESPVSRFRFESVTVDEIDERAFERLRRELSAGSDFDLDEGFLKGGGFPEGDVRNFAGLTCHGLIRIPLAESSVAFLRKVQPAESPQYWLPDIAGSAFVHQIRTPSLEQARNNWSRLNYPAFGLLSHDLGIGIRRPDGVGDTRKVAGVPRPVLGIEPSMPLVRTRSYAFLDQTPAVREAYERIAAGGGIPNLPHEAFDLDILDEPPEAILLVDGGWDAGFVACYRLLRTQSAELPEVFVDEGSTVGRQAWPLTFEIPLIERLNHLVVRLSIPLYSDR